jgi:excisionase family DNA binding protein
MLSDYELQRIAELLADSLAKRIEPNEQMLDVHEAARLLGLSVSTLERRTRDGSIPSIKIGRLRRYRRSELVNIADAS